MNATLCQIRKSTIVEVTKPPLSNGRAAVYLPEVEPPLAVS